MNRTEVQIGSATYYVSRVFVGSKTATELLANSIVDRARQERDIDVKSNRNNSTIPGQNPKNINHQVRKEY